MNDAANMTQMPKIILHWKCYHNTKWGHWKKSHGTAPITFPSSCCASLSSILTYILFTWMLAVTTMWSADREQKDVQRNKEREIEGTVPALSSMSWMGLISMACLVTLQWKGKTKGKKWKSKTCKKLRPFLWCL